MRDWDIVRSSPALKILDVPEKYMKNSCRGDKMEVCWGNDELRRLRSAKAVQGYKLHGTSYSVATPGPTRIKYLVGSK